MAKSDVSAKKVMAALQALGPKATVAVESALWKEANRIMAEAKKQTPVEFGNLKASGQVLLPKTSGGKTTLEMGFGGSAGSQSGELGYAIYVHEDLDAFHPVGKAKYLEDPMKAAESGFADRIAKDIKGFAG